MHHYARFIPRARLASACAALLAACGAPQSSPQPAPSSPSSASMRMTVALGQPRLVCGSPGQPCPGGAPASPRRPHADSPAMIAAGVTTADETPCVPGPPGQPGAQPASPVAQLALGRGRTCTRHADGAVCCWGERTLGSTHYAGVPENRTRPVRIPNLRDVAQLALGDEHSCARTSSGDVWCWGSDRAGELGDDASADRQLPGAVPGLSNVDLIAAGERHTCARIAGGAVYCWGDDQAGQCSHAHRRYGRFQRVPRQIDGLADVAGLSLGAASCAVMRDATFRCWGDDVMYTYHDADALPGGFYTVRAVRNVAELATAFGDAAGNAAVCARQQGGALLCWGGRYHDGEVRGRMAPRPLAGWPTRELAQLVAGSAHFCALARGDGGVWCWGANGAGQLGDGTRVARTMPTRVPGLADVVELAAARAHTCARRRDGAVLCWGDNDHGQLGDGTTTPRLTPVAVAW